MAAVRKPPPDPYSPRGALWVLLLVGGACLVMCALWAAAMLIGGGS